MDEITIPRSQYDELMAAKAKADSADESANKLATAEEEKAELQKKLDKAEVDKKAAEDEKAALKQKVDSFEEKANQETLGKERVGKLGTKFIQALPEAVKTRLEEQAGKLSDDDWTGRLDELAALVKVKADENLDGTEAEQAAAGEQDFTREEAAQAGAGAGTQPGSGQVATEARRRSVVAGL